MVIIKKITGLFVVFLLLFSCNSFAQNNSNINFFVGGGMGFPVPQLDYSGYSDSYNFGGGVAGGLSFKILPRFSFRTTISYHRLRFDEEQFMRTAEIQNSGFSVDGGAEKLFGLMGDFKYALRSDTHAIRPYLFGGYGAYRITEIGIYFPENEPSFVGSEYHYWAQTLKGGIGIGIGQFNNVDFFGEISISASFPESGESILYVPLTVGVIL